MLQLYIDNQLAVLDEDTSLDIEVTSPIWNPDASGAFAYEFSLDIEANRHIFGTADQIHGDSIYKAVHGKKFRLIAEGIPLYSGIVQLDSEVTIESGRVDITLASGNREFSDLISDMNCRDVDIRDDGIILGKAIDKIIVKADIYRCYPLTGSTYNFIDGFGEEQFELPLSGKEFLMVKDGNTDYGNVNLDYSQGAPYCNIRLCYQKLERTSQGSYEKTRQYGVMEYNDRGSAPSFYVMYWLDKLFSQIGDRTKGIAVVRNDLTTVPDFYKLAFLNTNPCFDVVDGENSAALKLFAHAHLPISNKHYINETEKQELRRQGYDPSNCRYVYSIDHNTGDNDKSLKVYYKTSLEHDEQDSEANQDFTNVDLLRQIIPDFSLKKITGHLDFTLGYTFPPNVESVRFYFTEGTAVANSDNFPDVECSEVIDALQNGFGTRFVFDSANNTVSIVLLQSVLSDTDIVDVPCIIHSVSKNENDISGFRLKYSATSDRKEVNKTKDKIAYYNENEDQVNYGYYDFSNIALENYPTIHESARLYERHTFYNDDTGNAYVVKVDKDATDAEYAYPAIFEAAQFNPAEFGDCSDDEKVKEVDVGFTPVGVNDVGRLNQPIYAVFVNSELYGKEENVEVRDNGFSVLSYVNDGGTHSRQMPFKVDYAFSPEHNFDRSAHEISPLYEQDWGLTLGLMRGPGSEGGTERYDENYDGQGNAKWSFVSGNYAFHFDTHDDYGNIFDYNGSSQGIGTEMEDRFSLRLRAEKPNVAYDPSNSSSTVVLPNGVAVPNTPFLPIDSLAARRGLFDKFYALYAYWVTHHKTAVIDCTVELSVLRNLDIMKHLRFGDTVGLVNKINYGISHDGMTDIKVELFYL